MKKKTITIADIARLAEVDKSTVSRAINGSDKVKPETKLKIQKIVEQYNFRPNVAAKALAKGPIKNIAIIVPDRNISRALISPVFPQVVYGIGNVAAKHDYNVTIVTTAKLDDNEYLKIINNHQADGFIIMGVGLNDSFPYLFEKENIPYIIIGKFPDPKIENSVSTNERIGGYIAAKHLLEQGHRDLLIFAGNEQWFHNTLRVNGVRAAFEEIGLEFPDDNILMNQTTPQKGYDTFTGLIRQGRNLPDAIFCFSDTTALAVTSAASDLGISIPNDLSIIGFGNHFFSDFIRPKLTTVEEELDRIGEIAMEQLVQIINSEERKIANIQLTPKLVVRDSTRSR
ncbi:LacI family DNA-binding transcriptional regulator [Paenibacillus herberti]|uniref:HTH lacI-type domain-containing protein n=1 Tax=Paenibacillus herberti TaxID=1619309 RepID=A0A229NXA2_9BACL|nr:LacI family DNA-binding transcriptional regulator [Paenibacillus herberti]OXM14562.1 hypothetical protein CGZ75_16655 [Paenibacillus herberti]